MPTIIKEIFIFLVLMAIEVPCCRARDLRIIISAYDKDSSISSIQLINDTDNPWHLPTIGNEPMLIYEISNTGRSGVALITALHWTAKYGGSAFYTDPGITVEPKSSLKLTVQLNKLVENQSNEGSDQGSQEWLKKVNLVAPFQIRCGYNYGTNNPPGEWSDYYTFNEKAATS